MASAERRQAEPAGRTGLLMITIAARQAGMHPQTLRVYETRGLIRPQRSSGGTRLYSAADIELLRRIGEMADAGYNATAIKHVLRLEAEIQRLNSDH